MIRDADRKNILELAVELTEMSVKARDKKITIEEMQGGSFTITNLGEDRRRNFSPIVNSPEVAILGVARAARQPVFVDGQIAPRLMPARALLRPPFDRRGRRRALPALGGRGPATALAAGSRKG